MVASEIVVLDCGLKGVGEGFGKDVEELWALDYKGMGTMWGERVWMYYFVH